jgi:hypothetical protein
MEDDTHLARTQPDFVPSNVVERLTPQDYAELKRMLCPFCRAGLPDQFSLDPVEFTHFIPGTMERFECQAMPVRMARGCVQGAIRANSRQLIEE